MCDSAFAGAHVVYAGPAPSTLPQSTASHQQPTTSQRLIICRVSTANMRGGHHADAQQDSTIQPTGCL
jgi:hypothetical protein